MNGGIFHSDPDLSDVWDSLGEDRQRVIEHELRQYEGRVRRVVIELKKAIDEARSRGVLRDEPLDLSEPFDDAENGPETDGRTGGGTA